MRVASGVVGHIARQHMASTLADQIDADYVSIDDGTLGAGGNHVRVWTHLAQEDADWMLVCEDDAVPVQGFTQQLHAALNNSPSCLIVSLYLGTGRPPHHQNRIRDAVAKAHANDAAYIVDKHLLHAVAVAVKSELLPPMLKHVQRKKYLPIDEAIGQFARTHKHMIAYTFPSLVQHRDTPTVMKHRDGQPRSTPRVAWHVGTRTDWTTGSVAM